MQFILRCGEQMSRHEKQMEQERTETRERLERLMTVVERTHARMYTELSTADEHRCVTGSTQVEPTER